MTDAEIKADVAAYMGADADKPKMQQLRKALENMLKSYDEVMERVKKG